MQGGNNGGKDSEDLIQIGNDLRNKPIYEKVSSLNGRLKELIRDFLVENHRKNNFIRIYPARSSDIYD